MAGRTTWWPKDAAWHRRELVVELGEEFGPGAVVILDVLSAWAQEQRSGGLVRGGFKTLARESFVTPSYACSVVARAGEISALDDLETDDDGRRFTCRVSGWQADQHRGRAAVRMADKRANVEDSEEPPPDPANEESVTSYAELRPVTPSALPNLTKEEQTTPLPPEGNRVRDRHRFDNDVRQFAAQQFGIESDEGWRNVRGAILSGARSPDEIVAWLKEWRPDLAPEESAA